MMRSHGVIDQFERIPADLRHRAPGVERKPVWTFDAERHVALTDIVEAKVLVEQPNAGSDRARRVVVLRFAEKRRASSLEVAKVQIIPERRADDPGRAVDRENNLRFWIVPL